MVRESRHDRPRSQFVYSANERLGARCEPPDGEACELGVIAEQALDRVAGQLRAAGRLGRHGSCREGYAAEDRNLSEHAAGSLGVKELEMIGGLAGDSNPSR